jgi:Flp pilus assembly protein TadD
MAKADDHQKLQTAIFLHQKGNLNEAGKLYRALIKTNPNNFHALHFLGVIDAGAGNIEQAKLLMARSLSIRPPNIQFLENYAAVLFQSKDYKSALKACQEGLQLNNANAALLYVSAISLFKLSNFQDAAAQFDKLLLLQPNNISALNERGSVLAEIK